jgi:hypothetical protein
MLIILNLNDNKTKILTQQKKHKKKEKMQSHCQ